MLEGLEAVELNFSELEKGLRMDSELYKRDLVRFERKIKKINHTKLGDEVKLIKKGIFDIKSSCYTEEGIPFVRISNLKNCLIDTEGIIFIPENENEKNRNTFLVKNDIVLSKTANAAASLVNIPSCNVSQDTVAIKLKNNSKLNSHFTVIYLNTKYGLKQMQRWFTGNIQMHLNLEDCKNNLQIPVYSLNFQEIIKTMFNDSIENRRTSQIAYTSAETCLLETLSLNNFEPSTDGVNVKSFKESFLATGRLDAEYYQKKFDILEKAIRSQKHKTIKEIRTDNYRGMQPIYVENGDLDIINSKHILEDSLDYDGFEKTSSNYWDIQSRARVYKGDILTYTTGANIGRTQVYQSEKKALASNHVNIIRIKEQNPVYIGFVLNSLVGRMQTDKFSAGSAQAELYPKDLDEFLIPIIENSEQEKIAALVEESFHLKKQSEQLLDTAKRAVEIAIEQYEEAAMRYIEQAQRD